MRSFAVSLMCLVALTTAACSRDRTDDQAALASGTRSATNAPLVTPSPEPKSTPLPTATPARTVAFPDVPLLTGTMAGELRRYDKGEWKLEATVCAPGQEVRGIQLAPAASKVLVKCLQGGAGPEATRVFLYDLKARTARELSDRIGLISPDARSAVATTPTACGGPAPGCWRRATLLDLQTGTEREIMPAPGLVGVEWRWTALGPSYFLPVCADSGCAGLDGKAGTYLWNGNAWDKLSPDRLVDADRNGTTVWERTRSFTDHGPSAVVLRTAAGETVLTPPSVEREYILALLEDGRVAAWRPDHWAGPSGTVVIYEGGQVGRESRGRFERFQATRWGDWLIATELSGAPSFTLLAYSLTQDAFAARPANLWLVGFAALPH